MADQTSIARNLSDLKRFDTTLNSRLSLKIWFDEKEEKKGIPLPINNIMTFRLRESMFLKLPVGNITYSDDGTFKNTNMFRPGRIIYIGFEYKPMTSESDKSNISSGRYRIENVKIINNGLQSTMYSVSIVYDALSYLNSIPIFPDEDGACLSTDAIGKVCGDAGLSFSTGVDTFDLMNWFNPRLRTCDFVSFVVSHSCISTSDFGMFWVNKNGEARYDGMKNILDNGKPYFFKSDDEKTGFNSKHLIFSDVFNKDVSERSAKDLEMKYKNSCWILFYGDQRNNDSWEAQLFGNSVEVNVYDTMSTSKEYPGADQVEDGHSVTHTVTYKPIQTGTSANDSTTRDRVQRTYAKGYVNPDLDSWWDISVEQNKIMRSEFFANRHTITINTGKQLDCFAAQDLRIGDPLEMDFTRTSDKNPPPENGRYIVHTIDWIFEKDTDLIVQLRVASDVLHPIQKA